MVDHGIKPCYVFDGKPPELKGGVVSFTTYSRIKSGSHISGNSLLNSSQNDSRSEKRQRRGRKKLERQVSDWPLDICTDHS